MDILNKLSDSLSAASKDGLAKAKEFKDSAKIIMDIKEREGSIQRMYRELGKAYYNEHKNDVVPEYEQIAAINTAFAEIEELKVSKDDIRGVKRCPICGEPLRGKANFCPNCGEKIVIEEAPKEEELDETPAEEAPVEEAPVEETPEEEAPVEEAPAEETPVEEAPAEEAPVEEAPAEEAPVEEAPAEEAPAEEAPVEETPAPEQVEEFVASADDIIDTPEEEKKGFFGHFKH